MSLADKLASLELAASSSSSSDERLRTLLFKPKPASLDGKPLSLVSVTLASQESSGPASALAKRLGLKDMRALSSEQTQDLTTVVDKARVSPLALRDAVLAETLVVLSETVAGLETLVFPSTSATDDALSLAKADFETLATESGVLALKTVDLSSAAAPTPNSTPAKPQAKPQAAAPKKPAVQEVQPDGAAMLGLTVQKTAADFGDWYQQVVVKGDLLEYYDVSGCYILKPGSYSIWEEIQAFFNREIKALGVRNSYFPMFVSSRVLEREKDHIEGFAPEVAWVTRAGSSDLEEPIAIRPTSETVMYPYYAKWIQSHRDLPLRLNQWNSVVRWEFKNPQPFLRTREFLWQEGHTAFLTREEAHEEVLQILDLYRRVYEDLLAVPVIPGVKSEKEKFAGGLYTTTVEGFIPTTGRGIQGGTSHGLGQNFSKMFNITVEDPSAKKSDAAEEARKLHVWQNSWGLSTRSIGVMVMVHSDDKGLVLPPRVAEVQVVVIPVGITAKTTEEDRLKLYERADLIVKDLRKAGIRSKSDLREGYTPGFKYNDHEVKGVPLRLELGPKDLAKEQTVAVRRDTGSKTPLSLSAIADNVQGVLETMHGEMLARARATFDDRIKVIYDWDKLVPALNDRCVVALPWCNEEACEDAIKDRSAAESAIVQDDRAPSAGAKSLCIPHDQGRFPALEPGKTKCPQCQKDSKVWTLFGRSY